MTNPIGDQSKKPKQMKQNLFSEESERDSRSVVSNSLGTHGLHSPWNSPGQKTGVGSHSLFQWVFSTQGLNPGLSHCRWILYQLSHEGSPIVPTGCFGTRRVRINLERLFSFNNKFKLKYSFNYFILVLMGFPGGLDSKESTCNAGDPGLIPGSG